MNDELVEPITVGEQNMLNEPETLWYHVYIISWSRSTGKYG